MRHAITRLSLPLLLTLGTGACDDEPPPGMIDALERALAGRLLGCAEGSCNGIREINISVADTADQLDTKAKALTDPWCPEYTFTSEKLTKNSSGTFSKNQSYSVAVVGFGEISVTSEDYEATIKAKEDGWKTNMKHNHQAGTGLCPADWPRRQCRVQPAFEIKSDGEVSISWIAGTETKSASGKGSEVIQFEPASSIEWCDKATHDDPKTCQAAEETSVGVACTSHADCAQLPCGEWLCQAGQCAQVEKSPDDTPCEGGSCKDGKCVKS